MEIEFFTDERGDVLQVSEMDPDVGLPDYTILELLPAQRKFMLIFRYMQQEDYIGDYVHESERREISYEEMCRILFACILSLEREMTTAARQADSLKSWFSQLK